METGSVIARRGADGMTDNPNWSDRWRRDGLTVVPSPEAEGAWCVLPGDDRQAIDRCPCCGMWLHSLAEAQEVADRVYPLE